MSGETIDGAGPFEFDKPVEIEGDVNYRSAETGQFVSEEEAEAHPDTTVKEHVDPTPEEMDEMVDKAVSLVTEKQGVNPKGSPNKLNKRSLVLNLEHGDELSAYFVHMDEDGKVSDSLYMLLDTWEDFGRPDTLTIVVYPRDILNS